MDKNQLALLYQSTLLDDVIPFWEKHSIDKKSGGYFTCLNRDGTVYDTDKFVWLQARQVWIFSMLYNQFDQRPAWLDIARHGATFLRQHGMDGENKWFFSLDRSGKPLVQPYNIFSDCFAAMAFAQYALASGDDSAASLAKTTFDNILRRRANPKGIYNKQFPGTRPFEGLALPMILSNLTLELEFLLPKDLVERQIKQVVSKIMGSFLDPDSRLVSENIQTQNGWFDSFDGRLINPGHSIEAMWFLMDIGKRQERNEIIQDAVDCILATLEFAWDVEFGGIYYFLDRLGKPLQQLEWDQKLWWVHLETLVALAKGYLLTGRSECWNWYKRVHSYTWEHFPDPEYGEWFGYLNRRGEVLLPLKGGKWKGCYHLPRALYQCWQVFKALGKGFNSSAVKHDG